MLELMEKGVWLDDLPDNVIVLSDIGEMIDGQHRCHAAILANRSFGAWVSHGHNIDTIKLLGQANPRRVSATLKMTGVWDPILTAATAKLFFNYLCGDSPFVPVVMTIEDVEEVYREIPSFGDWVKEGRRIYHARSFHSAAPTSALLVYLFGRTIMMNGVVARRFWQQVETGADAAEATLLLRNMWMNFRGKRGAIEGKTWHHNTCVRAWDRFRSGEAGKRMIVPRDYLLEWR